MEYNENGIFINDKKEYGSLKKTIFYLQSQSLIKEKGIDFIENGNYSYGIRCLEFGSFIVFFRLRIDKNEKLIDRIKGEYNYGINKDTETINCIIKSIEDDRESSSGSNAGS